MTTTHDHGAKRTALAVLLAVSLLTASCGTLLYPERRGQSHGRIDPSVAILDGVGLIVFLVPGLIAFGVDFATGAIYMPRATAANDPDEPQFDVVRGSSQGLAIDEVESIVSDRLGKSVDIQADTHAYEVADLEALRVEYTKLTAVGAVRFD